MPQVEFHILNEAGELPRLRYACGLIQQAYEQNQRSYVYAADEAQARQMDELLWTFRDQAFIPHELRSPTSPTHPRIMAVIGSSADAPMACRALLVNLSNTLPEQAHGFSRICEVVAADADHKQRARERYKQYREQGFELNTVNQSS